MIIPPSSEIPNDAGEQRVPSENGPADRKPNQNAKVDPNRSDNLKHRFMQDNPRGFAPKQAWADERDVDMNPPITCRKLRKSASGKRLISKRKSARGETMVVEVCRGTKGARARKFGIVP